MPKMMMMMMEPGPADGNDFVVGARFTNRIGEHRSQGARIVLGGILTSSALVPAATVVGSAITKTTVLVGVLE